MAEATLSSLPFVLVVVVISISIIIIIFLGVSLDLISSWTLFIFVPQLSVSNDEGRALSAGIAGIWLFLREIRFGAT